MSSYRKLRAIIETLFEWPADESNDSVPDLPQIQSASFATSYGIPPPPEPNELLVHSRRTWVPPGTPVTIAGRLIPQGALYVGKHLPPLAGWEQVDPALVNPALPVEGADPTHGNVFPMSPSSYARSAPLTRAEYLDWLAAGQPSGAQTSFSYLRLHSLERRMLFDARYDKTARAELPALIAEVRLLEKRSGGDPYFKPRVAQVLTASLLLHGLPTIDEIDPVIAQNSWELPMTLLIGLGLFAKQRKPLPAAWAYSWICSDPKTNLRIPITRLPDESLALFSLRYDELFDGGMALDPPKPRLKVVLHLSNPTFGGRFSVPDPDLPDLSRVRRPQKQLRQLLESVTAEIDEYSRAVGLSGDKDAPLTLAARPWALGSIAQLPSLSPLSRVLADALGPRSVGSIDVQQILRSIPGLSQPPTQKQSSAISRLARRLGYGLEPDPGQSRNAFIHSERAAIYRRDDSAEPPYDLAIQQMALAMAALLIGIDGTLDLPTQTALVDLVAATYPFPAGESLRLTAYVTWLADRPPAFAEVKRQWNQLEHEVDATFPSFLIRVAARDGELSSGELRMLAKLYPLFGRTEQQLHSDLHQHFASSAVTAPSRSSSKARSRGSQQDTMVDPHMIRQVQKQTDEIQAVLGAVFSGDDADVPAEAPASIKNETDPHTRLIAALDGRSEYSMSELTTLATSFGLMVSGAIETINDRAIALGLEPLFDCDDMCEIYEPTREELLAHG